MGEVKNEETISLFFAIVIFLSLLGCAQSIIEGGGFISGVYHDDAYVSVNEQGTEAAAATAVAIAKAAPGRPVEFTTIAPLFSLSGVQRQTRYYL